MNRKDCADRHSSKRDTFFNFGFKNRSEKKENRAKAKKFGFVTSITIKEDIWPELEVLQMKNKLALSLLLHPPRASAPLPLLPVGSQLYPHFSPEASAPDVV